LLVVAMVKEINATVTTFGVVTPNTATTWLSQHHKPISPWLSRRVFWKTHLTGAGHHPKILDLGM
jgi:hypothetical protein